MHSTLPAAHVGAVNSLATVISGAAWKVALFLFSVTVLLASGTRDVRGQSALDGFDPNANDSIRVVVVQPDGKILIGGLFTTLSPNGGGAVARNHIARLNPDGTLDTAFDPNADANVFAIALQPDGKILAGGNFTSLSPNGGGAVARNHIARLNPNGTLDTTFAPDADSPVNAIGLQSDGKVIIGGVFAVVGGQVRSFIARLDAVTGAPDSWNAHANGSVNSIVVQADGKILVGGNFSGANSIGGQTRNRLARLDATNGLADSFNPNADGFIFAIAVQADGQVLAGGPFNNIGGQPRNKIARLDAVTGLADSWNPDANSGVNPTVRAIAVQADGKIIAGGAFVNIGGQARTDIARLDAVSGLADSFDPHAFGDVYSIAVQPDSKLLAGGVFTAVAPNGGATVTRNHIARLERDGRLDRTLDLSTVGSFVTATAVQPDGKILIGGGFTTVLGVARNNIARLNADGTLDTAFDPNANGGIESIAVQVDGKVLVGGIFSGTNSIGGQTRNYIARLDPTTGSADSFDPNANNVVYSIVVQADGKLLAAGYFTSIGGQTRNSIARLDPTTGLADSFDPNANSYVDSIAVQADGKILAGGNFSSIGGQMRNYIARLDPTTGLPDSFNPNANNVVLSIGLQADGKILSGGYFTSIGGQTRNYIARLDPTTGLADSFDPSANGGVGSIAVQADGKIIAGGFFSGANSIGGATRNRIARLDPTTGFADSFDPSANDLVFCITVEADGKILAGGYFTSIGGQTRNLFARLSNDTAALQNLAVTQSAITWTRGGSSPQLTRVTFEYSTDYVNYTPLGNGTAAGSNWTLTGLNLSTGQNFYIRARGFYRGGYFNGSESIAESVRNAFIAGPTSTPTPPPTPTPVPTATPPTPSPTPTPPPLANISGTIGQCTTAGPSGIALANATMTLSGGASGSTLTDGSGNYTFTGLTTGLNYTVTPTKAARAPGSSGINTTDVIAAQRHFLNITILTGCRLTAADVNGSGTVNTTDVVAIQRFFLGLGTGTANVGKYGFSPASLSYSPLGSTQSGQNFDTVVFGDGASPFANPRPGGPAPDSASDETIASTVAEVALPDVAADQSRSNFVAAVTASAIDGNNKLVGFQGDFTFDERVVSFESEPVQKAGLTRGNWNVSGNVLDGPGPIRTLRISAFSNDFTPLSGSGTLFELRMKRVSKGAQSTPLIWAAPPDNFIFIDAGLKTQGPSSTAPGSIKSSGKRK